MECTMKKAVYVPASLHRQYVLDCQQTNLRNRGGKGEQVRNMSTESQGIGNHGDRGNHGESWEQELLYTERLDYLADEMYEVRTTYKKSWGQVFDSVSNK